jgi:integrase
MNRKTFYNGQQVDGANLDNLNIPQGSNTKGAEIMDKNINLYTYITLWLDLFKKNEVKQGTFERLLQSCESIGRYEIGHEKVTEVSPLDIQFYINQITKEGYSFSTIKKQLELLRASLRKAVKLKLISDNPAMEIGMPNQKLIKKPKEIKAYTDHEQQFLQQYIETHSDSNAVLCAAFMIETGLRSGEALALRWSEVDTDKHKCHVCATVINPHMPSKAYVQETPKTDSSIRTIPLNVRATTILNTLKRRATSEFIFGSDNQRLEYPTLIRTIKKMCHDSNVPYRGAHVFRHTFATNCYYKGIDIKILSKLLGHSDVKITYNTYINLYGDGFDDMYAALCL